MPQCLWVRQSELIPEQFTVKAHPALFEGEGSWKMWHCHSSLQFTYTFNRINTPKQTALSRTLCVYPWTVYYIWRPTQLYLRGGEGWAKNEALLFQSTDDIHFQNAHKTLFQSTCSWHIHFQNAHKHTQKLQRLALCVYFFMEACVHKCFSS